MANARGYSLENSKKISLSNGEFCRFDDLTENRNAIHPVCSKGTIWVTQPGDGRDLIIHEGDSLQLKSGRGLLIEAIGTGSSDLHAEFRSA
ncbi:MAG: DUF2917 domain-containing protein [Methylotenera sp.]|nr:DUF2917 domain-containing protein [Oligoflexia bacterium]